MRITTRKRINVTETMIYLDVEVVDLLRDISLGKKVIVKLSRIQSIRSCCGEKIEELLGISTDPIGGDCGIRKGEFCSRVAKHSGDSAPAVSRAGVGSTEDAITNIRRRHG